ncbi:plasmid mobilization protein [Faucicola atlantae]|uniref:Bacterial mobilisation domain-containing protein n=1 Tax=Faucicola atlantae TaxID=34059 RepID=A0A1B8QKT9_9GAMM|nr:hypothetical protein [Moraxella atlantae]OBX84180.1 hypothetical protein A9306_03745 [Moraxella atlantae]
MAEKLEEESAEKNPPDKKSAGKKTKPPLREKRLNIRFTDEEFALIESKADGMSLARYARAILTTGRVNRRERDFPTIDPKLMREIKSMGKNVNQLVRYIHTEANAKRPIDALSLALAIDRFSNELADLKQQYQVQISPNDFDSEQENDNLADDLEEIIGNVGNEKSSNASHNNRNVNAKEQASDISLEELFNATEIL